MNNYMKRIGTLILIINFIILQSYICFANINKVTIYRQDMVCKIDYENGDFEYIPCSCNKQKTRLGTFETSLNQNYRWHQLNADDNGIIHYGQYCVRFDGNILFHSTLYTENENPLSLDASTYNGIINKEESQGCIRLRIKDLKPIYSTALEKPIKVIVTDSNCPINRELLVCEQNFQLILSEDCWSGYDPTDEDAERLYYNLLNKKEESKAKGWIAIRQIDNKTEYIAKQGITYNENKKLVMNTKKEMETYIKDWNKAFINEGEITFKVEPILEE